MQAPQTTSPRFSFGGLMPVKTLRQTQDDESAQARARATAANTTTLVQSLAAHIRKHWTLAEEAKRPTQRRILEARRALRGEYDAEVLARLKQQQSSEIYMMLFASKARQFKALVGDILLGTGDDKPWTLRPSPVATLPPDIQDQILQGVAELTLQAENSPIPMDVQQVRQLLRDAKARATSEIEMEAKVRCARAEKKLEDLMVEGGLIAALDAFIDDLATSPTAFLKGPVVRMRGELSWVEGENGYTPEVDVQPRPHWERTDALDIYPAPWSRGINDAYLIEHHRLTAQSLHELIGVEGYSEDAIRQVIDTYGVGGLHNWLATDNERAAVEGRNQAHQTSSELIDTLQYWGTATGKQLLEWGLAADQIDDKEKVYNIEAWLVGTWVIKAAINADPLARRPYYACGFKSMAGSFWHQSLYETMEDCQKMCNAAARALSNNLGIASGPQVWVNVDRLPPGENIQSIYPWKITQTTSDPMGASAPPMGFFQPSSNAQELMGVFERFSVLADEYTGLPRYMTGDGAAGGAGRTASGMSMMVGNAGKTIKSFVSTVDINVISVAVSRGYEFMMRYIPDPDIKGDLQAVARGALSLMTKDAAQVRRNEFLQIALQSEIVQQAIGPEGLAALLRSTTKTLDMDSQDIVPSATEVRLRIQDAQMQAQQAQMMQGVQAGQGGQPQIQGPTNSAELQNGAPVVDNFGQ